MVSRIACAGVLVAVAACQGAEDWDTSQRGIVGGAATTGYPAVVHLAMAFGDGQGAGCSGTLVSPRVVLTAAHCLDGEGGGSATAVTAYFGSKVTGSDPAFLEQIPAEDWAFVPDWSLAAGDFGLVLLAHDAPTDPLPYNRVPLGGGDLGAPLHLVGWGNTSASGGSGTKREVTATLTGFRNDWVLEYGDAGANTCQGDSGGPSFATIGGQEVVVGVTSYGTGECLGVSGAGRVARFASAIDDFIDTHDVPQAPTVAFVSPVDGATVRPSFAVHVDAADDTRIERLELWVDGAKVEDIPHEVPPYIVRAPVQPDGPVRLEVRAYDNRGDLGSATASVTVDSSCRNSDDCGDGLVCEDGSCVAPEGMLGDVCDGNDACTSGLCGAVGGDSRCTAACTPGAGECPADFACLAVSDDLGYCWPEDEPEGGGCAATGGGSGGGLVALVALLALRRRRARA